jgi:hypothetical protein
MSDTPPSRDAPLSGEAAEPGAALWAPGVRLMRALPPGARAALLLVLSLLPLLSWLTPSPRPAALQQAWLPLLAVALYAWVCAGRVWRLRDRSDAAASPPRASPAHEATAIAEAGSSEAVSSEAVSSESTAHVPAPPAPALLDAHQMPAADVAWPPAAPADEGLRSAAAGDGPPGLDPADLRVGHAEIRGAVDEISRRVVSASGMLDACGKAADQALADIDALQDEDRHAQKMLSALRGRLLLLDQRCHALAEAAQRPPVGEGAAQELHKRLQAVAAQILHCHQLAERLGAMERNHGMRVDALRQGVGRVGAVAEGGLREAHQVMALTRRVLSTLDAADQDLARAGGAAEGAAS